MDSGAAARTRAGVPGARAHRKCGRGGSGQRGEVAHAADRPGREGLGRGEPGGARDGRSSHGHHDGPAAAARGRCARGGDGGARLTPGDARCLLGAWLAAVELDHLDEEGLIAYMQDERFSHSDLYRPACRVPSASLRIAVEHAVRAADGRGVICCRPPRPVRRLPGRDPLRAGDGLPGKRAGQARPAAERRRGAARGPYSPTASPAPMGHAGARGDTRSRGSGFEIEVVGTDGGRGPAAVAVTEFDVPHYPGLGSGSKPVGGRADAGRGTFDLLHVCSPGRGRGGRARSVAGWGCRWWAATTPSSRPMRPALGEQCSPTRWRWA